MNLAFAGESHMTFPLTIGPAARPADESALGIQRAVGMVEPRPIDQRGQTHQFMPLVEQFGQAVTEQILGGRTGRRLWSHRRAPGGSRQRIMAGVGREPSIRDAAQIASFCRSHPGNLAKSNQIVWKRGARRQMSISTAS
jgi:hypothetical protein